MIPFKIAHSKHYMPLLFHKEFFYFTNVIDKINNVNDSNLYENFIMYGNINMPWNGGRILLDASNTTTPDIDDKSQTDAFDYHINEVASYGMGINFVFTAAIIDLHDEWGNYMLNTLNNQLMIGDKIATVQSDKLLDYIKLNYPNIKVKSSLLKPTYESKNLPTYEYYNELLTRYDEVILHPDSNNDYKLLNNISDISKIEILVNENCPINCDVRKEHYILEHKIFEVETVEDRKVAMDRHNRFFQSKCPKIQNGINNIPMIINDNDMKQLYNIGIRNWKYEGRDHNGPTIKNILHAFSNVEQLIRVI
jgi:collagenase-like PrtC family protease